MRSKYSRSEFFERMKKKPALQKILDEFEDYSIEDLEKVDQPLWIREELIKRKNGNNIWAEQAERIAMETMTNIEVEEPMLDVRVCNEEIDLSSHPLVGNISSLTVVVDSGSTIAILDSNERLVRIGSISKILTKESYDNMLEKTEYIGQMTSREYALYELERLNKKHGSDVPVTENSDHSTFSFSIQRH